MVVEGGGPTYRAAPARRPVTWCSLSSRASRSAWTAQVAGGRSCSPRSRVRGWPCCCCYLALLPGVVGKGNPRVFCQEDVGGRRQSTASQQDLNAFCVKVISLSKSCTTHAWIRNNIIFWKFGLNRRTQFVAQKCKINSHKNAYICLWRSMFMGRWRIVNLSKCNDFQKLV